MFSQFIQIAAFVLPLVFAGPHSRSQANRHHDLAKRFSGSRWTRYAAGLGACGQTNVESDFIVALNAEQFGSGYPGPHCFETITMTNNGKTTQAQIMDRCVGCPYGGLDLSLGLMNFFSPNSDVLSGSWSFGDNGHDEPTTTKKPEPKTTSHTPEATTTTTSRKDKDKDATTTTTSSSTTSTSTTSSSSSSTTEYSPTTTTTSTSSSSIPTATGNINLINQVVLRLGQVAVAGY